MRTLIILLFISFNSFGQDINLNVDKKIEYTEKKDTRFREGLHYQGLGTYTLKKEGYLTRVSKKSKAKTYNELESAILNEIKIFTDSNEYNFKIFSVEKLGTTTRYPSVLITFKVFNKDDSLVLNKDEAKKQLLELKEYLDLGIITQQEYDDKAASLKKILL